MRRHHSRHRCVQYVVVSRLRGVAGLVDLSGARELWRVDPFMEKGAPWLRASDIFGALLGKHRGWPALRYWELIRRDIGNAQQPPDDRLWAPNQAGLDFLEGRRAVPQHALIYDGELVGFDGLLVTCRDAVSNRFRYVKTAGKKR